MNTSVEQSSCNPVVADQHQMNPVQKPGSVSEQLAECTDDSAVEASSVEITPAFADVNVLMLPVDSITPDPSQARKHFDADELLALAVSLRDHGMLHPIHVRLVEESYVIISGERRFRAACEAGFKFVPCAVLDTNKHAEISLAENFLRSDLTAIEKAEALHALQVGGTTLSEIASMVGLKENSVSEIIGLTRLSETIKDECRADSSFSLRELKRIACVESEQQAALFDEYKKRKSIDGKKKTRTVRDFDTVTRCSRTLINALGSLTLSADHDRFNEISTLLDDLVAKILVTIRINQLVAKDAKPEKASAEESIPAVESGAEVSTDHKESVEIDVQ